MSEGEQMTALAKSLGLEDYDLLVIADGSGTLAHTPCGWYATSYTTKTGRIGRHRGGASGGTNNYAELMPFLHVLWAYHSHRSKQDSDLSLAPDASVACISDSELTVRCGNGEYSRKANGCLWAGIEWFEQHGYKLSWAHVPRNSNTWNTLADHRSREVRRAIEHLLEAERTLLAAS